MLTARPSRLRAAAAALEEAKGGLSDSPLRILEQRERLLSIPADRVERYRINPRALDILPALATMRRDVALQERVIALAAAQSEQMSWDTIARLVPWQAPLPRWLVAHWRAALGRERPAEQLAQAARQEEPILARLLGGLELPLGSPLAAAVLTEALADRDGAWLDRQPYTETLRFIEDSGAPTAPRAELMRRILARHGGQARTPAELTATTEELFAVAHHRLLGWPPEQPGMWRGVPASVLRAARWCARLQALRDGFGDSDPRVTSWRRWLRHLQRVEVVGGSVVGVQIGVRVFAEPREQPRVCRVYTAPVWADFCARQAASDRPLVPPRPDHKIPIHADREGIDAYISERIGLRP
ncbi:MAG: hypothetical protein ACI8S6_003326 [Myxococcota bacterium]|jgi:hypothetical protein